MSQDKDIKGIKITGGRQEENKAYADDTASTLSENEGIYKVINKFKVWRSEWMQNN